MSIFLEIVVDVVVVEEFMLFKAYSAVPVLAHGVCLFARLQDTVTGVTRP